jgi:hypothetical protein
MDPADRILPDGGLVTLAINLMMIADLSCMAQVTLSKSQLKIKYAHFVCHRVTYCGHRSHHFVETEESDEN